jgi:outer membrane receptor for ferric coprogen and ferric-rhodotorulic acid
MTSSEGTIELRDLPTGEWMLMVMKAGFIPVERPVVIQATPTTIALTLDVAGIQESVIVETTVSADPLRLNSVAAGGTLLEIPIRELPASLTVVTQELMQERGATTAMQAVELASGITTCSSHIWTVASSHHSDATLFPTRH